MGKKSHLLVIYCEADERADKVEEAEMVGVDAGLRVWLVDARVGDVEESVHGIENLLCEHGKPLALHARPLHEWDMSQGYSQKK